MSRLKKIVQRQSKFASQYTKFDSLSLKQKEWWTEKYIQLLMVEACELLDEVNFKPHRKIKKKVDEDRIKSELMDIFCFFLNLCLVWGLTDKDIYKEYVRINDNNWKRSKAKNYIVK